MHSERDKIIKPVYDSMADSTYHRLEGFASSNVAASKDPVTIADIVNQASRQIALKQFHDAWRLSLLTVGSIFGLLLVSSVILGLAASRLTLSLKYLRGYVMQQIVEDAGVVDDQSFDRR